MGKPNKDSGISPQSVGALAGALVFVASAGLALYFVEVRGTGVRVEWMSGHGPELGILGGVVLAVSLAAHLAVAGLGQRLRSSSRHRQLLHHALEVDYADPDVVRRFSSIPDLRELVGLIVSEKSQNRDLEDRVEALRGEFRSLVEGMQRSSLDLGRMREESASELGMLAVATFNGLLERTRTAEAALAESEATRRQLESEHIATRVVEQKTFAPPPPANVAAPDLTTLVTRLDELEGELQRLRAVTTAQPRQTLETTRPKFDATPPAFDEPETTARPEPLVTSRASMPVAGLAFEDLQTSPAPPARWNAPAGPAPIAPAMETEEMPFPHFVGRPVRPVDHVQVSYEASQEEEVMELPASALLFEDDEVETAVDAKLEPRLFGTLELER